MRKLIVKINQTSSLYDTPVPYFIPVPPDSPPSPPLSSSSAVADLLEFLQPINLNFFNPSFYYYTEDEPFELEPKEWVALHFDKFIDNANHWNGFGSCVKKRFVFFGLQNRCDRDILVIPKDSALLQILIMPAVKSFAIPSCSSAEKDSD